LIHCTRCGLPETYETVEFDAAGVCNICRNSEGKQVVDWIAKHRELNALVEQYRGRHAYDCIVPFSGGKDSTFTLWYLVTKFHVKPLVVQFDHGFMRPNLLANNERTFKRLGVDVLRFTPNWKLVKRVMLEALIRKGDFCWHCHTGIFAYPMQVALKEQVPLIFWGEPSTEYTAYYQPGEVEEVDETRFDRFVNLGITAEDMAGMIRSDFDFDFRDLAPFTYPKTSDLRKLGVRSVCLGSYIPWDTRRQSQLIAKDLGWQGDEVEGMPLRYSFEKIECSMQGVRDYIKWLKRGYSRVTQMTALDLRAGRIERPQARALVEQYVGKRPASLDVFLEYIGLTEEEFNGYVAATVIPPHTPDFKRPAGIKPHDFDAWWREPKCSPSA
jgi:N-acetyl sugar amidotransferase